jgi:uncharacterized protein (DUF4415 family)
MNTKNKKSIKYGKINITKDEFLPRNVKVRITTLLDQDILDSLRAYAEKSGVGYQTALNGLLRVFFDDPAPKKSVKSLSEQRVRKIVQEEIRKSRGERIAS